MRIRTYGNSGHDLIVLHGGPGAPGYMAAVARQLADSFRVFEPLQRGSGELPLSVAVHVADLHALIQAYCRSARPALLGHSWGAMLALAYAAAYPDSIAALALVGCGTFDPVARAYLNANFQMRLAAADETLRRRLERLPEEFPDPDQQLSAMGRLILPLYSHELISAEMEMDPCDARAHHESWDDMLRLQAAGVYPAAFSAIKAPAIMLHGALDPHPGRMIWAGLKAYMPQLEYHEWEHCGHYPWLEKAVGPAFFAVLRAWLARCY